MKFKGQNHQKFFFEAMKKCKRDDSYHRAFFYIMGLTSATRFNINDLFDFEEDLIKPDGLHAAWQTGGTVRICRMAFNLWNDYITEEDAYKFTPSDLFCCEFAPYFVTAICLRYPEYMGDMLNLL